MKTLLTVGDEDEEDGLSWLRRVAIDAAALSEAIPEAIDVGVWSMHRLLQAERVWDQQFHLALGYGLTTDRVQ